MSVTRLHPAEKELYLSQVQRLVNSDVLHGSESLCRLLRYLAEHALEHPGVHLKEYQIATEVFGRPADFDPQLDSTIRVQAGRLRSKLAAYYSSEGNEDAIVIEMPKGSYLLYFHQRSPVPTKTHIVPAEELSEPERPARKAPSTWAAAVIVLASLLAVALIAIVSLSGSRNTAQAGKLSQGETAPAVYQKFWQAFLSGPEEPWVVFSNGAFVGRPETGMRYFDPARDSRDMILDHYTGVGEVLAVHTLDRVFEPMRRELRVKRGSLFSLDDAKNNDLIFVGSPAENLTLREIPNTQQFIFQRLGSGPRKGDLAIINVHPQPGEPPDFLGSPANAPLSEDYSVIALVRGLNPERSIMILAGTTTIGTQAAVEYVCDQNTLSEFLPRLNVAPGGDPKPFEAVLRVRVTRGVPVETKVVALRNQP